MKLSLEILLRTGFWQGCSVVLGVVAVFAAHVGFSSLVVVRELERKLDTQNNAMQFIALDVEWNFQEIQKRSKSYYQISNYEEDIRETSSEVAELRREVFSLEGAFKQCLKQ